MTAKVLSGSDTFLPSWSGAKDPSDPPPFRMFAEDGTVHFSDLKRLQFSGKQYLEGLKPIEANRAMLIGTGVHHLVLGPRTGASVVFYDGEVRRGKEWTAFAASHPDSDILTAPELAEAKAIADAVLSDPLARARLDGAQTEVPLTWMEGSLKCSTSGVDILSAGALGDLKTTATCFPEVLQRQCFRMAYHAQLAFYRRGALANGLDVSKGLFLLCVESRPPYECVDLELTEGMIELAERTVSLLLERLTVYAECRQFPGYAQSPIPWDVPAWMRTDEDEEADA